MPLNVYVVAHGSGWAIKNGRDGSGVATHSDKNEALAFARNLAHAKGVELVVIQDDGTHRVDVLKRRV